MTQHEDYNAAVEYIRQHIQQEPKIGLVLGSGLGTLADDISDGVKIPYAEIPGWPASTVEGHHGNLVIGTLEGHPVVVQQGRAHFYEGYTPQQITFPIRVMHLLGVETLILTNAAGGLNTSFTTGDIMLITDHINFVGITGNSPLVGPNDPALGERFVSMVRAYDADLQASAARAAQLNGITLRQGVYVCLSGPQFETPAEIRMLRTLGGDAVGMSTAHEVIVARHMRMRVLAFSSITNVAIDANDTDGDTNHQEVLDAGKLIVPTLTTLLHGVLRNL